MKKYAAKGRKRKTLSAADSLKGNNKENEKRTRIYQEIDRLRKNGYSITKAIELMRNGTYGSRMREVSGSTWRRYYLERCRRNRLADAAKALGRDRVNDRVNSADDRVNALRDRVNDRVKNEEEGNQEGLRHCLYVKILQNPGKKSKELSLLVNKSVPTVSRYLKLLKVANQIEFRGAPKTGGYYANN